MNLAQTSAVRWAELRMVPLEQRDKSLVLLAKNAFFDESGTHDGSPIVAMAGLIASYDSWARFEVEWNKVLASKQVNVFHFNDFMAGRGEFDNRWGDLERNEFMERLCVTVSDNIVLGLACSVYRDEYDRIVPIDLQVQLKDPYYFGLYSCLYMLVTWPHLKARVVLPRRLEFLFDRKKKYEGLAADIYYAVIELLNQINPGQLPHTIFGDMAFGAKDKDIPLQAADLFVGVAARNYMKARRQHADLEEVMERSLRMLGRSGRLLVSNAGVEALKSFVNIFRPGHYPEAVAG